MKLFQFVCSLVIRVFLCVCVTAFGSTAYAIQLVQGWNLLGNNVNQIYSVATLFGDPKIVITVWKWDTAMLSWQFYSPSMTTADLQTYAASKGYGVLSQIKPDEGYWVNANAAASITPSSTASISSYMNMAYTAEQSKSISDSPRLTGNGADYSLFASWKEMHVQNFLNTVLAYIQIIKNTNPVDKVAVVSLLNTYQTQDISWNQYGAFTASGIGSVGYYTIVNFAYTNALVQLNAM